jgi:hypothetical protein
MRQYPGSLIPVLIVLAFRVTELSGYREDTFGCVRVLEAGISSAIAPHRYAAIQPAA